MSYLVLARKYRSKQFNDIVGQESVVKTLVNAMKLDRTHHAYVFSGSRGIGKTSIARIFSKALRCPNVKEVDGILISCDACSDCHEIAQGNSVNVIEIDGASNNGVDAVREIRESAKFLPTSGKHKVYIIDEVHMLSTAAFNALLKTLEEPPEHIVFIFATTEAHKIPETILGRCQRFDFKRITLIQMIERMKWVLSEEGIPFEDSALMLIARAAEGSMRDALSLLDQVISFSGMNVTAKAVRESMGLIGTERGVDLVHKIFIRDVEAAIQNVNEAYQQGVELKSYLRLVTEILHAALLLKVGVQKPDTHFGSEELLRIQELISLRPLDEMEMMFQVFHHTTETLSKATHPKMIFDVLIMKAALAESLRRVDAGSSRPKSEAPKVTRGESPTPADLSELKGMLLSKKEAPVVYHQSASAGTPSSLSAPAAGPSAISTEKPKKSLFGGLPKVGDRLLAQPVSNQVSLPPAEVSGEKNWEGFVDYAFQQKPVIAVILESVVEWIPAGEGTEVFRLKFRSQDQQKADQLQVKTFREQFSALIEGYYGKKGLFEVAVTDQEGESLAERAYRLKEEAKNQKIRDILSSEVVQEARALFGAELSQIEFFDSGTK